MFTGIIEEVGKISRFQNRGNNYTFTINCNIILEDIQIGDSISVNGICLTVTDFDSNSFTADVMPVTVEKSSLNNITINSAVNLERALRADSRFGGHFISGHVDSVGKIEQIQISGNAIIMQISTTSDTMKFLIAEGSISIDGISLTISRIWDYKFEISLIPHTYSNTILHKKNIGDYVNIEVDQIGKYLFQYINKNKQSSITKEFLIENGF